jgi:type I restriction enzyme, S subunit
MENKALELPKTWVAVNLGDFVENDKGKKPKNESKTQTAVHHLPYVDIQTFEENIVRTWTDGVGCRLCSETDFLMVWDGSRSGLVGKGVNGALGSTLVRINFPSMVNDYAYYFLQSKYQQINTRAKGTGTPHVDPDLLWNYKFPIPPLAEQHRIVAKIEELFSELDKGIDNLKTALAQLKVYRQALLKHAFEGKLTARWREQNKDKLETASALQQRIQTERAISYQQQLADWKAKEQTRSKPNAPLPLPPITDEENAGLSLLPVGWGWFKVGSICDVVRGGSPRPAGDPKLYGGNIPFLKVADITATSEPYLKSYTYTITEAGLSKTRQIEPNTLLLSNSGATLGVPKICLISATMNDGVAAFLGISKNTLLYHYYFWESKTEFLRNIDQGAAQPNLNTDLIKETFIPICSEFEMATVIEKLQAVLSDVDHLELTITTALQQSEALRQSILKKAFSGTLVAQDTNDEPASVLLARIKAEITTKPSNKRLAKGSI